MTVADIIQIIIGVLSLGATIAISIVLAVLESRKSKHQHDEEVKQAAKEFIIDNQDEIDYLPLCVMANLISEYRANVRKIYNRFNRCTEEVQKEILRQQNIPLRPQKKESAVDDWLRAFDKQAIETKLWKHSWLYDGAKYFHRSITDHREELIDSDNPYIFDVPSLNDRLSGLFQNSKFDLVLYMDRYLEFVLRDREDTKNRPELLPQQSPMEVIDEKFNLGCCEQKILCFWVMRFIQSGCIALWRHGLISDRNEDWRHIGIESGLVETYEDMYYETILTLYTSYGESQNID